MTLNTGGGELLVTTLFGLDTTPSSGSAGVKYTGQII